MVGGCGFIVICLVLLIDTEVLSNVLKKINETRTFLLGHRGTVAIRNQSEHHGQNVPQNQYPELAL